MTMPGILAIAGLVVLGGTLQRGPLVCPWPAGDPASVGAEVASRRGAGAAVPRFAPTGLPEPSGAQTAAVGVPAGGQAAAPAGAPAGSPEPPATVRSEARPLNR
jgi:hypothetical protein